MSSKISTLIASVAIGVALCFTSVVCISPIALATPDSDSITSPPLNVEAVQIAKALNEGLYGKHVVDNASVISSDVREKQEERLHELFVSDDMNVVVYYASPGELEMSGGDVKAFASELENDFSLVGRSDGRKAYWLVVVDPVSFKVASRIGNEELMGELSQKTEAILYDVTQRVASGQWDESLVSVVDGLAVSATNTAEEQLPGITEERSEQQSSSTTMLLVVMGITALAVIAIILAMRVPSQKHGDAYSKKSKH